MTEGLQVLSEHAHKLIVLVQMIGAAQSDLPCFEGGVHEAVAQLRQRLLPLGQDKTLSRSEAER